MLATPFEQYLQDKEAFLDSFIDAGSEQELFAASYIHGHLSVVAANIFTLSEDQITDINKAEYIKSFNQALRGSVNKAIDDKELVGKDINDVNAMLARLLEA